VEHREAPQDAPGAAGGGRVNQVRQEGAIMSNTTLTQRSGWVTFAGVTALVVGAYNALSGIAAFSDDETLAAQASEVLYGIDLTVWGWLWLLVGALQILAGVLILRRSEWGRALGVSMAGLSAIITVFVIFVFPLWAIAVLTLDALVLYGLLTSGEAFD
jgi:hypothetical protein